MTTAAKYEVVDGYGKVWYAGSLRACGFWIDPVLGIDWDASEFGRDDEGEGVDDNRITLCPDGSYVVAMYELVKGESGGEMVVRPVR